MFDVVSWRIFLREMDGSFLVGGMYCVFMLNWDFFCSKYIS